MPHNKLIIHHLSDLHFGLFHKFLGKISPKLPNKDKKYRDPCNQYIQYLQQVDKDEFPDFFVISGDITSLAEDNEFKEGQNFIVEILKTAKKRLGCDYNDAQKRIIIVPGNHDFSYAQIDETGSSEASEEHFFEKFQDYHTPFFNKEGAFKSGNVHFFTKELPGISVVFICINSCAFAGNKDISLIKELAKLEKKIKESSSSGDPDLKEIIDEFIKKSRIDPGYVEIDDLSSHDAFKQSNSKDIENSLKICVIHHPPFIAATNDIEEHPILLNAGNLMGFFQDNDFNVHLMLCGHMHVNQTIYQRPIMGDEQWGMYASIGGTLGGEGDDEATFSQLVIQQLPIGVTKKHSDGWLCNIHSVKMARTGKRAKSQQTASFFIERDQIFQNKLYKLHTKRAKPDKASQAESFLKRINKFLTSDQTLDSENAERFGKLVFKANRIYALDIQAFDAWIDPITFYYFTLQTPKYVASCLDIEKDKWYLRVSPVLGSAIERARKFAKTNHIHSEIFVKELPYNWTEIHNFDDDKVPCKGAPHEIVRLLLWPKEVLMSEEGKAFCKMHDKLRIPLFYLNPNEDHLGDKRYYHFDKTELKKRESSSLLPRELFNHATKEIEYIYGTDKQGKILGGLWVDLSMSRDMPKDIYFSGCKDHEKPVAKKINPKSHMETLLLHKHLRFATDAIRIYKTK